MPAVAGRPTVLTPRTAAQLVALRRDGLSAEAAARRLGISRRSAFRAIAGAREASAPQAVGACRAYAANAAVGGSTEDVCGVYAAHVAGSALVREHDAGLVVQMAGRRGRLKAAAWPLGALLPRALVGAANRPRPAPGTERGDPFAEVDEPAARRARRVPP